MRSPRQRALEAAQIFLGRGKSSTEYEKLADTLLAAGDEPATPGAVFIRHRTHSVKVDVELVNADTNELIERLGYFTDDSGPSIVLKQFNFATAEEARASSEAWVEDI